MLESLHRYCLAHYNGSRDNNAEVLSKCSRLFHIDGQDIDWDYLKEYIPEIQFTTHEGNISAQDSIHFQQLRSFILSRQLLQKYECLTTDDTPLRVAIVGGGFSGLTSALTFLKCKEVNQKINVDVFEHHKSIFPRFHRAFGRRIYPYHHLRAPNEVINDNLQWSEGGTTPGNVESGGIKGVLTWKPGPVERVISNLEKYVISQLSEFNVDGRNLRIKTNSKVQQIQETSVAAGSIFYQVTPVNFDLEETSELTSKNYYDDIDQYDVVIIAAGGSRDQVTILGQYNDQYWQPKQAEIITPRAQVDEIAIIGAGNTAASEVFNYSVENECFAELTKAIQSVAKTHPGVEKLLNYDYSEDINFSEFQDLCLLNKVDADIKFSFDQLKNVLTPDYKIGVTLFAQTTDENVFKTMNPLNKFLVLFLDAIEHIKIRDLNQEFNLDIPNGKKNENTVLRVEDGLFSLHYANNIVVPDIENFASEVEYAWTAICNCTGTKRVYQAAFNGSMAGGREQNSTFRLLHNGRSMPVGVSIEKLLSAKINVNVPGSSSVEINDLLPPSE